PTVSTLFPTRRSSDLPVPPPINTQFQFSGGISVEGNAAVSLARVPKVIESDGCAPPLPDEGEDASELAPSLASLKPSRFTARMKDRKSTRLNSSHSQI